MIFCSHVNKTHFSRKVLHFALFWKWEFLKLENDLLSDNDIVIGFWMFQKVRTQSETESKSLSCFTLMWLQSVN